MNEYDYWLSEPASKNDRLNDLYETAQSMSNLLNCLMQEIDDMREKPTKLAQQEKEAENVRF